MIPPTIDWDAGAGAVVLIDQRRLPDELVLVRAATVAELGDLIRDLAVRGAPALGLAGALGMALAARTGVPAPQAAAQLVATRPTAVNLEAGVARAMAADDPLAESLAMLDQDRRDNEAIGRAGASLLPNGARVLTHCNAGALACGQYGTALGVVRAGHEAGRVAHVWVDETRPVLQGARLTAWELDQLGIAHTVLVDAAAGGLLAAGEVDAVVVGADRVARNGDVANKVGTYPLAVLAERHGVPVLVAFPTSTVDPDCATGGDIPVEQRADHEVTTVAGARVTPAGTTAWNPAFDVTPASLVSAYVTERGVLRAAELVDAAPA